MSPIVWDLGHIANYEEIWSIRALDPAAPVMEDVDWIYDPLANPRPTRKHLPLPDRDRTLAYMHEVRARVRRHLAQVNFDPSDPLLADGYVYKMIAQHEAQHSETILQTIQLIEDVTYEPGRRVEPRRALVSMDAEYAVIPAGPFVMGTDDRSFAYDNERPAHVVELPRYRIDLAPVTNAQYLAFMLDGGYRRRALRGDGGRLRALRRLRRLPLPRVLRGALRQGLQRAARRLVGDASDLDPQHVPQLGPAAAPADLRRLPLCRRRLRRRSRRCRWSSTTRSAGSAPCACRRTQAACGRRRRSDSATGAASAWRGRRRRTRRSGRGWRACRAGDGRGSASGRRRCARGSPTRTSARRSRRRRSTWRCARTGRTW